MAKFYEFYHPCFDDYEVSSNGGLVVKPSAFQPHKMMAKSEDPSELWSVIIDALRKDKPDATGIGNLYWDSINDCTYVIFGNHYYEDMGVIVPCLPKPDFPPRD